MQEKYIGDSGDFGKYLLLRYLCRGQIKLGVNWCMMPDDTRTDGKKITYLFNPEKEKYFRNCLHEESEIVYDKLKSLLFNGMVIPTIKDDIDKIISKKFIERHLSVV